MTAVSTLRDDLTFIVSMSLRKYVFLNSHFPNIISTIVSFSKLLPEIQEFMQIQELSRISKVL